MTLRISSPGFASRLRASMGFTLIELLIVIALMGIILTLAAPRLSAFMSTPEDRELRDLEHFVLRASRRATRSALVPENQPDAKPLRIKIVPPKDILLLQADTELAKVELSLFRIEDVEQDGRSSIPEPEFLFSPLGLLPSFSIELERISSKDRRRWQMDRLGGVQVSPAS